MPVQQKKRPCNAQKIDIVAKNVYHLLQEKLIRMVIYLQWNANVVVVRKKNHKWRVYVDFQGLNKACSKANFSVPKIGQLVDAACNSLPPTRELVGRWSNWWS